MNLKESLKALTKFEICLWFLSAVTVTVSFALLPDKNWLSLAASLLGVTALIFVAKGLPIGQALCIVFAVLYGIISFQLKYYGEVITYLGMSAPAAIISLVSWLKHPYRDSEVVAVARMTRAKIYAISVITAVLTFAFYFILKAMGTANLLVSTISVATSLIASTLTFLRSPYYAIGYALNDVVLIVLWVSAGIGDPSYFPMVACFVAFLANDLYGFINWLRIRKSQNA